MICTPSSSRPSRVPAEGNSYPYASHSCWYQPAPIPISTQMLPPSTSFWIESCTGMKPVMWDVTPSGVVLASVFCIA